ncbi:MAG: hypothetical protein HY319_05410 [Armatimonadetes bacterium]|nr:hypothetical protein [Armatimonadota bacterium]
MRKTVSKWELAVLLILMALIGMLASGRGTPSSPPVGPWNIDGLSLGMTDEDGMLVRGQTSYMSSQYGGKGVDNDPFYAENPGEYPAINRHRIRYSRTWNFNIEQEEGIRIEMALVADERREVVGIFGETLGWAGGEGLHRGETSARLAELLGEPVAKRPCGAGHADQCELWEYRDGLTVYLRRQDAEQPLRAAAYFLGLIEPFRDVFGPGAWPPCLSVTGCRPGLETPVGEHPEEPSP